MSGCECPDCEIGKLYQSTSRKILSFSSNAPVNATRYEKEALRCNACQKEFTNSQRIDKWNYSAKSTIVLYKIMGMPFNRMSNLQCLFNTPISEGAMWQQIKSIWEEGGEAICKAMYEEAANCKQFYADDTGAQILEVTNKNKTLSKSEQRKCHTSIFCTETESNHKIVLYITDNKHCGENFATLLESRTNAIAEVNWMSDASNNNLSKLSLEELSQITIFKCLAHGRRKFHELLNFEPLICSYFLSEISSIYKNDDFCKSQNFTSEQRLFYHQEKSKGHIDNIYHKINELFSTKDVEPNSALGKAMKYWLNHREGLTKFQSVGGMSLDNNIAEQGFKNIILQRKNSYFFKTKTSAAILSGMTSLVMTCKQNNINAYGYLNWIQRHWLHALKNPSDYLPWKYTEKLNKFGGDPPAQDVAA